LLELAATEIGADLDQGELALATPRERKPRDGWHRWLLDANGYRDPRGEVPPIAESTLRRTLTERRILAGSMQLLGPFATDLGRDAVVVARADASPQGTAAWTGSWKLIDELMSGPRVADMLRQGYQLQMYDATAKAA